MSSGGDTEGDRVSDGLDLKRIVRDAIAAFNEGDLEAYFELHTPTTTVAEAEDLTYRAATEYRHRLGLLREQNPRARVEIDRLIAEPPTVVMQSRFVLDASDAKTSRREAVVFDFEFGRIARTTVFASSSFELDESPTEGVH